MYLPVANVCHTTRHRAERKASEPGGGENAPPLPTPLTSGKQMGCSAFQPPPLSNRYNNGTRGTRRNVGARHSAPSLFSTTHLSFPGNPHPAGRTVAKSRTHHQGLSRTSALTTRSRLFGVKAAFQVSAVSFEQLTTPSGNMSSFFCPALPPPLPRTASGFRRRWCHRS